MLQDLRASKKSNTTHLNFLNPDVSKLSNVSGSISITFAGNEHWLDFAVAGFHLLHTEGFLGIPAGTFRSNGKREIT